MYIYYFLIVFRYSVFFLRLNNSASFLISLSLLVVIFWKVIISTNYNLPVASTGENGT